MKRAALAALLAAGLAAGCGGAAAVDDPAPAGTQARATDGAAGGQSEPQAGVVEPTPEQLAFREQLVKQLADGTYVACTCTAEIRARERIASGKVKPPPPDRMVSALP